MDKYLQSIIRMPGESRSLDQSSILSNPSKWFEELFAPRSKAGVPVTSETIIGLPAVWTAVRFRAETFASLPCGVFEDLNPGKKPLPEHPVYDLIKSRPNSLQTSYEWRLLSEVHELLWGNAFSLILFDNVTARPTDILPFHPKDVTVRRIGRKLWYRFVLDGRELIVDQSNVLHSKGIGFDGILGKSVIQVHRENLGASIAQQEFSSNFYRKGAKLDGVIQKPSKLNEGGLDTLRQSWRDTYGNPDGERVAVLDDGMEYKAIGVPPNDSQFIETRKFSVTDAARIFRVPPPLLYDLERATFSNIEALILTYVKFTLVPSVTNREQLMNKTLLREDELGKIFTKFNIEGLLRGDVKQRREYYDRLFKIGVFTQNDILALEDMNPYPEGDKHYILGNMVQVEKGTPPPPED